MRIAFIAHLSEVSGAGIALLDTAVAFQKAGHDVTFIIPGNGDLNGRAAELGLPVVIIPIEERSIGEASAGKKAHLLAGRMSYIYRVRVYLKRSNTDIAYVNSSNTIFAGIGARLAGLPIVWHIHETLDKDNRQIRVKKTIIRRIANGLVYASQSAMDAFPPENLPSMIARNAVDIRGLMAIRHRRPEISADDPMILLNGTIRRKGADVLLKALHEVKKNRPTLDIRAVITGSDTTDPAFYREMNQLLAALELDDRVVFVGIRNSLKPLMETATLYISASRNEAMPIAIVEAMAAGVPVIATAVGDCAALLDNGRCGWVIPSENPEALATAITEALDNPHETDVRAKAAAEKVDRLYGNDDFWQPLMQFVDDIVNRN